MADVRRLPGQNTDHWDWQTHGLCRGMDSDIFFHPTHERGVPHEKREETAKELCRRCPVLQQCRTHALTARERYGIWGGLSAKERDQLLEPRTTTTASAAVTTASVTTADAAAVIVVMPPAR